MNSDSDLKQKGCMASSTYRTLHNIPPWDRNKALSSLSHASRRNENSSQSTRYSKNNKNTKRSNSAHFPRHASQPPTLTSLAPVLTSGRKQLALASNPSRGKGTWISQFLASLIYRGSRRARETPFWKTSKQQQKKEEKRKKKKE